jgi:hypothetical protein
MRLIAVHESLIGQWIGKNQLWANGSENPPDTSDTRLIIAPVARGKFLSLTYTWSFDGVEQEGVLLVGNDNEKEAVTAAWVDSWHMSTTIMSCAGKADDSGNIDVLGSYQAPPGPDWGWRIEVARPRPDALVITMYNVTPEGQSELAVRADYERLVKA